MNQPVKDSKTKLLDAFQQLLTQHQQSQSRVATKAEEAQKLEDQEILTVATTYTVDSIVKGLADLQLDFGTTMTQLSEKLRAEVKRLVDLKQAIDVETRHLQDLQRIRLAADALYLLTQEHQENLRLLETKHHDQREVLQFQQAEERKRWQREDQGFETSLEDVRTRVGQERQRQVADFSYELGRQRQVEQDAYEERRRAQERELQDLGQAKAKDWAERREFLTRHQAEFETNQQRVEAFPAELDQAVKKARTEGIEETNRDAKVKADLQEREWTGIKQGYELKIQSLEQVIERQVEQITDLSNQLQAAMQQAQELAMRAFAAAPSRPTPNS